MCLEFLIQKDLGLSIYLFLIMMSSISFVSKHYIDGISEIITYLRDLGYEDSPDYDKVLQLFDQLGGLASEDEAKAFDWVGEGTAPSGFQRAKLDEQTMDTAARLGMLGKAVQGLVNLPKDDDGRGGGGGPSNSSQTRWEEIEIAQIWSRVSKKVLDEKSEVSE